MKYPFVCVGFCSLPSFTASRALQMKRDFRYLVLFERGKEDEENFMADFFKPLNVGNFISFCSLEENVWWLWIAPILVLHTLLTCRQVSMVMPDFFSLFLLFFFNFLVDGVLRSKEKRMVVFVFVQAKFCLQYFFVKKFFLEMQIFKVFYFLFFQNIWKRILW